MLITCCGLTKLHQRYKCTQRDCRLPRPPSLHPASCTGVQWRCWTGTRCSSGCGRKPRIRRVRVLVAPLTAQDGPERAPLIAAGGVQGPANCLERQRPASIKGGRGGGGIPLRPSPRVNAACLPRVGVL
jgi:hypothetical protein